MIEQKEDFFSLYLEYTNKTECPTFFHRWTAVGCLAAFLGRQVHFEFGHFKLHPNLYTILVGSPGTKKSTGIKIGAKLLKKAGYKTFGAKKTRQEKFLMDLAEQHEDETTGDDILDQNLWGDDECFSLRPPAEVFVAADEFNNFIGTGNLEFMSILGELWDYEGVFDYKLKNSKSVAITDPTVNILGGNTPTGMAQAFPSEAIGQGFFSRLLLVYGEPTGVKYTIPPEPSAEQEQALIEYLAKIRLQVNGAMKMTPAGMGLLDKIYHEWEPIDDVRFEHYSNRRLTQLIKLCMVMAAADIKTIIEEQHVLRANTLLSFTEHLMPKALGEFGKGRHSDIAHKILMLLDRATKPITQKQIWKHIHTDLERREQMIEIIQNLITADKIQVVDSTSYLPKKKALSEELNDKVDWTLLTNEERGLL